MEKEYTVGPIQHGDYTIEAQFEALPGETEGILVDFLAQDASPNGPKHGTAQLAVLIAATRKITADDKVIFKNSAIGAKRIRIQDIQRFPQTREYFDRKKKLSLARRLLKEVVEFEFWLPYSFPDTFDEFVEDDEAEDSEAGEAGNPTDDQSEQRIQRVS